MDINSNDLFVLWGGGNDMFAGVPPELVADNLAGHVMTLLDHGATDVVFLNMFNGVGRSEEMNRQLTPKIDALRRGHTAATIKRCRSSKIQMPTSLGMESI
jgi:hypothetical protein